VEAPHFDTKPHPIAWIDLEVGIDPRGEGIATDLSVQKLIGSEDLHEVEHSLERRGETSFVIGSVVKGRGVEFE